MSGAAWERVDLFDPVARQSLLRDFEALVGRAGRSNLLQHPEWLIDSETVNPRAVQVYVVREGSDLRAYAPFLIQPWSLRFLIGESTLFSIHFERIHINGEPFVERRSGNSSETELLIALIEQLRHEVTSQRIISLEGVPVGSDLDRAIRSEPIQKLFKTMEPALRYERRLIRFPSSFQEYMQSIKSQTRQSLRNKQHKLERHLEGKVRLVRCIGIDDVPDFVDRAVAISKKTYQWNLLGLGLRDPEGLKRRLIAMARRGWTRCYLLECDGAATAFMIGYLHDRTYYYIDVGFDPAWEKWSVGTVLHLEVLRDLMDGDADAEGFDFSTGSGVHKKRFSNLSRLEANYLLLQPGIRSDVLVGSYRLLNGLSTFAVGLLDRLHIKTAVKRLVRTHAISKASGE